MPNMTTEMRRSKPGPRVPAPTSPQTYSPINPPMVPGTSAPAQPLTGTGVTNYPNSSSNDGIAGGPYIAPQALPKDVPQGFFADDPDVNMMAPSPMAPSGSLNQGPSDVIYPSAQKPDGGLTKLLFIGVVVAGVYFIMK